jgi:hypothetical protein
MNAGACRSRPGWFAQRVRPGGPDGSGRLGGRLVGARDRCGQAAADPGGARGGAKRWAPMLVVQMPSAGLGQPLALLLTGSWARM